MPQTYEVSWDRLPPNLKSPPKRRWLIFFWDLLSLLLPFILIVRFILAMIRFYAAKLILPSVYLSNERCKESKESLQAMQKLYRNSHKMVPKWVQTPDGALIKATLFKSIEANPNTPTVIYFHGNYSLQGFGDWKWFLHLCLAKNVHTNLIIFDYRGTGESKGSFRKVKDLLIDCASILSWVRVGLKTLDSHIHFYGMSLGGALALKTKAIDPKLTGFLISERSFSNVESLIYSDAVLPRFVRPFVPLIMICLKYQEMNLDPSIDLKRLSGKKLFVYHKSDPIIPYTASMALIAAKIDVFELREKIMVRNHHCEELTSYLHAEEKVFSFALSAVQDMDHSAHVVR